MISTKFNPFRCVDLEKFSPKFENQPLPAHFEFLMYGYNFCVDVIRDQIAKVKPIHQETVEYISVWLSSPDLAVCAVAAAVVVTFTLTCVLVYQCAKSVPKSKKYENLGHSSAYQWTIFDLAKTAYEAGHTEAVINLIEKLHYDVNSALPSNGLTIFLCACLSGKRELINYMMNKGADVTLRTKEGDSALYLATFGVLNSVKSDTGVLEDLIKAGCGVNSANVGGYTPLHRAASRGDVKVLRLLLRYGADPYLASVSGIYPIDCAINAGHLAAAELLKINIANPHVWDVVDPHTPSRIKLGLQSPQRRHLIESSKPTTFSRVMT